MTLYSRARGFALPTVLISSVVLLTLLLVSIESVQNVRQSMKEQYYMQLAKEAAESGVQHMQACVNRSFRDGTPYTSDVTLTPSTGCDGTPTGTSRYVIELPRHRTTYTASLSGSSEMIYEVSVTAKTELLRTSNGASWKTYSHSLKSQAAKGLYRSSASFSGYNQVCGVIDLKTWCWGENNGGQLGDGTTTNSNVPVRVVRDPGVLAGKIDTMAAVGDGFACSLSSNEVYCWGENDQGQLGRGDRIASLRPVKVDHSTGLAGKKLTQLVANEKTACVIADGDLYCWGDSRYGQLGIGVGISDYSSTGAAYMRSRPVKVNTIGASVSPGLTVTKVAATAQARHFCALVQNGDAYCWGGNDNGQLGWKLNNYYDQYSPVKVVRSDEMAGHPITDISLGGWADGRYFIASTCAIAGGAAFCWGANDNGQSGQGTRFSWEPGNGYTVPVKVTTNIPTTGLQQIAVGSAFACARQNNRIWCWGENVEGMLGLGYMNTRELTPHEMPNTTNALAGKTIKDLRAGAWRGCVLADGKTYCWGDNSVGQLGDGTLTSKATPTEAKFLRSKIPMVMF